VDAEVDVDALHANPTAPVHDDETHQPAHGPAGTAQVIGPGHGVVRIQQDRDAQSGLLPDLPVVFDGIRIDEVHIGQGPKG
jgi:hypothetical protein